MNSLVVWRLVRKRYASESYSGEGSRQYGGRWSSPGTKVAYCSESRSLAALEVLVNVRDPTLLFGDVWMAISATIPVGWIERPARVPESWRITPHSKETQVFGSDWARDARTVALRVPSAVVLGEFNYLLNPGHPDFPKVAIGKPEAFAFDPRFKP